MIFAGFCAYVANEKNRNSMAWLILGLIFSFVALLSLIAVPVKHNGSQSNYIDIMPNICTHDGENGNYCTQCGKKIKD